MSSYLKVVDICVSKARDGLQDDNPLNCLKAKGDKKASLKWTKVHLEIFNIIYKRKKILDFKN